MKMTLIEAVEKFFDNLRDPYSVSVKVNEIWLERPWDLAWKLKGVDCQKNGELIMLFDGTWDGWEDFFLNMTDPRLVEYDNKYLSMSVKNVKYIRSGTVKREAKDATITFVNSTNPPMCSTDVPTTDND